MPDMLLLKFFSAFVFVIALMLLLPWVLKRIGISGVGGLMSGNTGPRRLKVVESLPVDHQRRLVLVRCDEREHLLLLGRQGETVVATNMPAGSQQNVQV